MVQPLYFWLREHLLLQEYQRKQKKDVIHRACTRGNANRAPPVRLPRGILRSHLRLIGFLGINAFFFVLTPRPENPLW
jgi:hypothetical protein